MPKKPYLVVTHVFKGGRFDDHGIDVDVLPDLIAFKTILIETAKEIWRRNHLDRQRLPKNFEDSLSLKFYEILPGSAGLPLMREIEVAEAALPFEPPRDELDEAVELLTDTIRSADEDNPLPAGFPKNVIQLFESYGRTLRPEETFELKAANDQKAARYSSRERDRLMCLTQTSYEDMVDLVGEIRAADLDGRNFALRLTDETKVEGKFSPEQETMITEALREHASRRLHIKGRAEFIGGGKLKRITSVSHIEVQPRGRIAYDENARPIWESLADISNSVSPQEWAKLPSDLSKNIDHYLYGTPKQE
jgi:hypothetical protein